MMEYLSKIEREIVTAVVEDALKAGLLVSVYDGEEYEVKLSSDRAEILQGVGHTGETTLVFRDPAIKDEGRDVPGRVGSVLCIMGNEADILSDWSDNERTAAILFRALQLSEDNL